MKKQNISSSPAFLLKHIFVLLFAFLVSANTVKFNLYAQSGKSSPIGKITGKITDKDTKKIIARATVAVHNPKDSSIVTGSFTDKSGNFTINSIKSGDYYIRISFLGYQVYYIDSIKITQEKSHINIGTIALVPDVILTKEVKIVAEREAIEIGFDRKVFNIEQDVTNLGGSAVDVLANIPSVTVDQDDNVSLRGNSNVRIMIDGRMSNLSASEALDQIPATMISSVELITNPGARYDAEGTAGIINIVTTKQREDGANAMINLNAGADDDWNSRLNGSVSANWNIGKWNLFASLSGRRGNRGGTGANYRTMWNKDGVASYLNEDDTTKGGGRFISTKVGADYNFSKNDVLTYSFRINKMKRLRDQEQTFLALDHDKNLLDKYERVQNSEPPFGTNTENTLSYKHNFEQKGHELYVDAFFTTYNSTRTTNYEQRFYSAPDFISLYPEATFFQKSLNDVNSTNFLSQIDYARPIGKNLKLETGIKYSTRSNEIETVFDSLGAENNNWINNIFRSDNLNYKEDIYAAYITASSSIGDFKYQIGVRSETTIINFDSYKIPDSSFTDNYTLLFPSVYLTYQVNPSNQFNLSFSSRMRRPNYWELNPITNYEDLLNLSKGNPRLKPESMYASEFSYMFNIDRTTITTTLFYRYTTDGIERYKSILNGDTTMMMPVNISNSHRTGFELIAMQKINDWWKVDGNYTFYNTNLDASNLGGSIRNDNSWSVRINSIMNFNKTFETQLSGNYRSKMIIPQGESKANWNIDASFKYSILQNLSVSFRVQDIFNTRQWESYEYIPGVLYNTHIHNWNSRGYFLGLTYKINDYKQKRERKLDDNRMNESED